MTPSGLPTYSLADMQRKIEIGHYMVRKTAQVGAAKLELDEDDIRDCVCGLTAADFYKTGPSEKVEGTFQDVYKTWFLGKPIYTKLSLTQGQGRKTVIISFKRDESAKAPGEKS